MATTAVITARTTAFTTLAQNLADGELGNYYASGLAVGDAPIKVQVKNAAGVFGDLKSKNQSNQPIQAEFRFDDNYIQLVGPLDFVFAKPVTKGDVDLVRYS